MALAQWIADNHFGDLASVTGIVISIVGFAITIWNVLRSKSAAKRAEAAAAEARRIVRSYQAVSDFSAAIATMEEIKRLHRIGDTAIILDRYAALRKILIGVRQLSPAIDDTIRARIQSAVTNLTVMEHYIEKSRAEGATPNFVRLNRLLSKDVDDLQAVLVGMADPGRRAP